MNLQIEEKNSFIKTKNSVKNKSNFFKKAFKNGDKFTRLSFFIMGISNLIHGQIIKGLIFLFAEISFLLYMIETGMEAVLGLRNLGEVTQGWVFNEELGIDLLQDGDNSMLILLFGVFAVFIIMAFISIWITNIKSAIELQQLKENGKNIPAFKEDIKDYLDGKLHNTLMFLPLLGIFAFTILPLVFMILVAFTNYDSTHQPPGSLFTWVGLENFRIMLGIGSTISNTFWPVLGWTLVWAVTATFSTYIGGILLALLINKKNVKIKGFWRTMFILSIAIPQFVTLLTMQTMLQDEGAMNVLLQELGLISAPIHF
jgi:ABC-type sugar transport systems, permease components